MVGNPSAQRKTANRPAAPASAPDASLMLAAAELDLLVELLPVALPVADPVVAALADAAVDWVVDETIEVWLPLTSTVTVLLPTTTVLRPWLRPA